MRRPAAPAGAAEKDRQGRLSGQEVRDPLTDEIPSHTALRTAVNFCRCEANLKGKVGL